VAPGGDARGDPVVAFASTFPRAGRSLRRARDLKCREQRQQERKPESCRPLQHLSRPPPASSSRAPDGSAVGDHVQPSILPRARCARGAHGKDDGRGTGISGGPPPGHARSICPAASTRRRSRRYACPSGWPADRKTCPRRRRLVTLARQKLRSRRGYSLFRRERPQLYAPPRLGTSRWFPEDGRLRGRPRPAAESRRDPCAQGRGTAPFRSPCDSSCPRRRVVRRATSQAPSRRSSSQRLKLTR